ncbi:MAG: transcription antitermination factor NusB [bacterium]|nr:transcription antitermination factor NusB [bacterium]
MSRRRKARELALDLLYRLEISSAHPVDDEVRRFWEENPNESDIELFASIIVKAVLDNRERIDELISDAAENWKLHRIAPLELNIIRMATAEMFYIPDVPPKVSLNEAIEIAKKFGSSPKSHQFVNGVLDNILHSQGINV